MGREEKNVTIKIFLEQKLQEITFKVLPTFITDGVETAENREAGRFNICIGKRWNSVYLMVQINH